MTFIKVVLPGRVKCGGTKGEIVVAHDRLPSPARPTVLHKQTCKDDIEISLNILCL